MPTVELENNNQNPTKRKEMKELRKKEKRLDYEIKSEQNTGEKQKRKQRRQERKRNKIRKRRLIPIWAKVIIVLVLSCAALLAGMMVGYGVLGSGNPTDALEIKTWTHIIDIVLEGV